MRTSSLLAAVPLALASCATPQEKEPSSAAAPARSDEGGTEKRTRTGVLMPAEHDAISLWPEAYAGELLVLEVQAHGTAVAAGEVVARLETKSLERQIDDARLELESARIEHEGLLEKHAVADEAAASRLERARAALDRARRGLEGYETAERAFKQRSDDLSRHWEKARVDDQVDELAQLQAMYEADELTDATEEIVLKRSQRDLALTRERNDLEEDRRVHRLQLADELEAEAKREEVARKEEELEHLARTQAVEARGRDDAARRSAAKLEEKERKLAELRRDLELLSVRAPRTGTLLHGSIRDYRPGGSPRRLERGSKIAPRDDVFLIAAPEALAVAVDVPESLRASLPDGGGAVTARPVGRPDLELRGTLTLADFPRALQGDESVFEGTVALDAAGVASELVIGTHVEVEVPRP